MEPVEIISDDFLSQLNFKKFIENGKQKFNVSLIDFETSAEIFNYQCSTFITGDLILHLRKGIEKYINTGNKIILSRWYPKVHSRFLCKDTEYPYITTSIYKDPNTNIDMIKFIVYIGYKNNITFIERLKTIKEYLL